MQSDSHEAWAHAFVYMVEAIDQDEAAYKALRAFADQVNDDHRLRDLLNDPAIPVHERIVSVAEVLTTVTRPVASLLAAMIVAGDSRDLHAVADTAWRRSVEAEGVLVAKVTTPYPLSVSQEDALTNKLTAKMGKPVTLDITLDRSLIGGLTIDLEGELHDASIARRLEDMHHAIADAA